MKVSSKLFLLTLGTFLSKTSFGAFSSRAQQDSSQSKAIAQLREISLHLESEAENLKKKATQISNIVATLELEIENQTKLFKALRQERKTSHKTGKAMPTETIENLRTLAVTTRFKLNQQKQNYQNTLSNYESLKRKIKKIKNKLSKLEKNLRTQKEPQVESQIEDLEERMRIYTLGQGGKCPRDIKESKKQMLGRRHFPF